MAKNKKSNSTVADMEDKLDGLFMKALDVVDGYLDKIKAGEVDVNGHTLNSVVGFLEKNEALLPAIRNRRVIHGEPSDRKEGKTGGLYDHIRLPEFEDEDPWAN